MGLAAGSRRVPDHLGTRDTFSLNRQLPIAVGLRPGGGQVQAVLQPRGAGGFPRARAL